MHLFSGVQLSIISKELCQYKNLVHEIKYILFDGLARNTSKYHLPWSQRFSFAAKREERKKRREKTSGSGRYESIMLR